MNKDKEAWDKLSLKEKAQLMKIMVSNGETDLRNIKKVYNSYAIGGPFGKEASPLNFINRTEQAVNSEDKNPKTIRTKNEHLDYFLPDEDEYYRRQSWAESKFNSNAKSHRGATGMNQVMPSAMQTYNKNHKTNLTMSDMQNDSINNVVRLDVMRKNLDAPWNSKPQLNANKLLKDAVAYNWGNTNLVNTLNKAKKLGYDIYYDIDWLELVPKESQDYSRFIVFGEDTGAHRNLESFKKGEDKNKEKVENLKSWISESKK